MPDSPTSSNPSDAAAPAAAPPRGEKGTRIFTYVLWTTYLLGFALAIWILVRLSRNDAAQQDDYAFAIAGIFVGLAGAAPAPTPLGRAPLRARARAPLRARARARLPAAAAALRRLPPSTHAPPSHPFPTRTCTRAASAPVRLAAPRAQTPTTAPR